MERKIQNLLHFIRNHFLELCNYGIFVCKLDSLKSCEWDIIKTLFWHKQVFIYIRFLWRITYDVSTTTYHLAFHFRIEQFRDVKLRFFVLPISSSKSWFVFLRNRQFLRTYGTSKNRSPFGLRPLFILASTSTLFCIPHTPNLRWFLVKKRKDF